MILIKLPYEARFNKFWNPGYKGPKYKRKEKKLKLKDYIGKKSYDPYQDYLVRKELFRRKRY